MIIGNGDIAEVLRLIDRKDLLFFASGVSNSQETRDSEYQREVELLMKQDREQHIVYFGSLSIFYSDSQYAKHKRYMEGLIKGNFKNWTIIRIGNITWGINPNTIINSFRRKIKNNEPLEIRSEYRYVVGTKEFIHWVNKIPDWNCEMNIPGRMMTIKQIVDKYGYTE